MINLKLTQLMSIWMCCDTIEIVAENVQYECDCELQHPLYAL